MPSSESGAAAGRMTRERARLARHVYDLTVIGHSETDTDLGLEMERCWPAVNSSAVPLHLRLEGCSRARDLMHESYNQSGSKSELEWAIRFSRLATSEEFITIATPEDRIKNFYTLCDMLLVLFNLDDSVEVLQESITWGREGRNLACSENFSQLRPTTSLGDALVISFRQTRNTDDLEEAILLDRQGVNHSGIDSTERWRYQANLATRLLLREPYSENAQSRREALDIISVLLYHLPRGHALQDTVLRNLASIIGPTTEEDGFWTDPDGPFYLCRRALHATVSQNVYRAGILTSMAAMLRTKFEATEDLELLQEALRYSRTAIGLIDRHHSWRPTVQKRYAEHLKLRFDTTGCVADLEEAIAEIKTITDSTREADIHRSLYLNIQICLTVRRFIMFGLPEDLLAICEAMKVLYRDNNLRPALINAWILNTTDANGTVAVTLTDLLNSSANIPSPTVVPPNPRLRTGEEHVNGEVWEVMVGVWYRELQRELGDKFNEDDIIQSMSSFFGAQFNLELVFEAHMGYDVRRVGRELLKKLPGAASFSFRFAHWIHLCDLSLRETPLENVDFVAHRGRRYHREKEVYARYLLDLSGQARRRKTTAWFEKSQHLAELAVACLSPNLTTGAFSSPASSDQITGLENCSLRTQALGVVAGVLRRLYSKSKDEEHLDLGKRYAEISWAESGGNDESVAFVYGLILKEKHLRTGELPYLKQAIARIDDSVKILQHQTGGPSSDMLYELGVLLRWSYMVSLDLDTLNKSIVNLREALEGSDYDEQRSLICNALAVALVFRGRRFRSVFDLDEAAGHCQAVVDRPRGANMVAIHYTAANIYSVRADMFPRNDQYLRVRNDDFQMAMYHMRHADRLERDKDPSRLVDFALIMLAKYDTTNSAEDATHALMYIQEALHIYDKTHRARVVALRILAEVLSLPAIGLRVDPLKTHLVNCLEEALDSSNCTLVTRIKAGEVLSQYQSLDGKQLEYFETLKKMVTLLAENLSRLQEHDRLELAEIIEDLPSEIAAAAFSMGVSSAGVVHLQNRVENVLSLSPSSGSQGGGIPITNTFEDMEL